ncbi:MAG: oligopeptide/dipeptide ABC transporter ATP-binding protein [Clostridiales bacterium]
MDNNVMLSVKNLSKYFPTAGGMLHAVDGVSFDIKKGTTLGVVGESGCGKSTLGRVILHLLPSTAGQIFFNGKDITNVSRNELHELRKQMQIIFQDPFSSIDPRMSVKQLISEPLKIYKLTKSKEELEKKVKEIMDIVGLASRLADSYAHELDGGRRQRIGVGRAIILNPSFIVCDEPVSALDVSIQAQILNLMQDLQEERNLTYIFVTHNLSVVRHISTDIMVMYLGCTVEKTNAKELFAHQYHPYTKALISAIPHVNPDDSKKRILLKGELTSPINPKEACRFAPRCNYACDICHCQVPVLEEIEPGHFVACHLVREINGLK